MPYIYNTDDGNTVLAIDGNIVNKDFCISRLVEKINSEEAELKDYISSLEGIFCIVYISKNKMIVIRDKHGIKPLCIGRLNDTFVACSETCALDAMGAVFIKDIERGEIYIKSKDTEKSLFSEQGAPHLCT